MYTFMYIYMHAEISGQSIHLAFETGSFISLQFMGRLEYLVIVYQGCSCLSLLDAGIISMCPILLYQT